jgi:hypothetical protein
MNLWAAAPLIATALLSGGTGVNATAANHFSAATPTPTPSVAVPSSGAPSPVLRQVGQSQWETTVLLNDTGPACGQARTSRYSLATTGPNQLIPATLEQVAPITNTGSTAGTLPYGSSCQVTVVFANLGQVPETAALVVDQPGTSSTVTLTVSRNVNVTDYLGIPVISGLLITILTLLLSVLFVRRRGREGYLGTRDWLERPITGSGAWTANDSWATNISTGLVVVATVLGATTAVNSMFPGVALDRFSIVNIAAGFFVVAAPVVFGILYSWFTASNPGLTADAVVRLPLLRSATIGVPSGASITLAADTTFQDGSARWAVVRGGGTYEIPPGADIQVLAGIQAVAEECVHAAEPVITNVLTQALGQTSVEAATQTRVDALRALRLAIEQAVARAAVQSDVLGDEPSAEAIRQVVMMAVAEDGFVRTAAEKVVRDAADASGRPLPQTEVTAGQQAITLALARALTHNKALAQLDSPVRAASMTCPGSADIGVLPGSTLRIAASGGTWTIPASDVLVQPQSPPASPAPSSPPPPGVDLVHPVQPGSPDVPLGQPMLIEATGGAKVTVTGAADIILQKGAVISSPQRPDFVLPRSRRLLTPQGTNVIVANLSMILFVNLFTMFGIGAELGIAGVLADFSDATVSGRSFIFVALAAVAVLVVFYAVTATRTMADPQPGSSISSESGASFTL